MPFDRLRVRRVLVDFGVQLVDRLVRRVTVRQCRVEICVWKSCLLAQDRKHGLGLRDQLLARNQTGVVCAFDSFSDVFIAHGYAAIAALPEEMPSVSRFSKRRVRKQATSRRHGYDFTIGSWSCTGRTWKTEANTICKKS